ncbi:MAG: TonB family protein [Terriglobales bacterium]
MQDSVGTARNTPLDTSHAAAQSPHSPQLLVEWSPAGRVFRENLLDLLLRREPAPIHISAAPGEFWPDVFVHQRLPWRKLAGSGLYHALAVVLVYFITLNWPQRAEIKQLRPNDTLTYYNVSEYLPEINTGTRAEPKERRGEPALAKQHIRSIPAAPDNFRQTIVTADPTRIHEDVPLPNLVANTAIPAPPEAAIMQPTERLTPTQLTPVEPPPAIDSLRSPVFAPPAPQPVGPPVDVAGARSRVHLPNVPGPEVVGPPPSLETAMDRSRLNVPAPSVIGPAVGGDVKRPLGAINMAHTEITAAAPRLPVIEQQAGMVIHTASGSGGHGGGGGMAPVAPPPVASVSGAVPGSRNAGQIIALGIHPVAVNGPITVPHGSRSGEFEAGPEGKPNAPGTPDVRASSANGGAAGNGNGNAAGQPGISISRAPGHVPSGGVVAAASPTPPVARPPVKLLPSLRPMSVADIARTTRPIPPVDSPESKSDEVFGTKKYYSMTLNMPSVTSLGGSCIIRFAELNEQRVPGELTAPVATLKVDPAYPPEEIRDRVEGTVTLYAIIRADGSVGEVRVLHGIDATLDRSAIVALSRWQFRPATRNGNAVALEAVVQIPFVARRKPF